MLNLKISDVDTHNAIFRRLWETNLTLVLVNVNILVR